MTTPTYRCPECGRITTDWDDWQRHNRDEDAKVQRRYRLRYRIPKGICVGCWLGDASPSMHDLGYGCEYGQGAIG